MAYDGLLLRAMIFELRRELIGLKVEKINQPQRGAFVFTLKNKHLLISVEPSASYVALTDSKMANPAEPPMFCMLLRKYLSGAVLTDIRQNGCDRTIYFVFSAFNSSYEKVKRTLVAEIMGRHANLLLLDEEEKIIDCIKRASLDSRQALPGLKYEAFSDVRRNILDFIPQISADASSDDKPSWNSNFSPSADVVLRSSFDEDTNFLKEFQGFSKISALYASNHYFELNALLCRGDDFVPKGYTCAENDGSILDFYFLKEVLEETYPETVITEYKTLSEATNAFYMRSLKAIRLKKISQEIKKTVSSRLERIQGKISKMQAELETAKNSAHLRHFGDLLLAYAHEIRGGSNKVTLTDFKGGKVEIPLDTRLSATENAQKYYHKYKKSLSAVKNLEIQIREASEDVEFLSTCIVMLDLAENEQDVNEVRKELEQTGFFKKGIDKDERKKNHRKPIRTKKDIRVHRYTLSTGKTLLVGRSNTANDELTMKYASNSDTWLHTNTIPGSHCIIRCEGQEPTDQEIEEAAKIAAYYSKARISTKVPVDYCKVKHIKKPPGAKAGMVIYTNFKTILVNPDVQHLKKEEAEIRI